ncbi:MAG: retroviral-like aspartic protease family protein [Candidatus Binatia bacterium]
MATSLSLLRNGNDPAQMQVKRNEKGGEAMGITYTGGTLTGPTSKRATVRFLVDSGAVYTLVPHDVWKSLDLIPKRTVTFTLADGTPVDRPVSECRISLPQGDRHTPVILGEPGDEALLGTVTLEELGLVLHPFKRTLEPMRMLLA